MLYVLRLTNGDSVVVLAADERSARKIATTLNPDEAAEVDSVRRLDSFALQLSPNEEGTLEVAHWHDATLDNILVNEYPLLNDAYRRANAEPFLQAPNPHDPPLSQLKAAHERNKDIIRQGLRLERQRSSHPEVSTKSKAATGRR